MTDSAVAQQVDKHQAGVPSRAPGQHGAPWWRVTWSVPAAMRAVRATIVIPSLFAITFKVLGNEQMTVFAVFGGFGALVLSTFGGSRRDKAIAHFGLAVAGSVALILGTLASGSAWLAALVTLPVAFTIYFAGSAGPNAASGVTACLLAFVLPVASTGAASAIPSRLEGWWLASAAAAAAVLLLSPRSPGDRLRAQAAATAAAIAHQLQAAMAGTATAADREATMAAKRELMDTFVATPYRPIGLAEADQGLASLIHLLDWCASLTCDAMDGHVDLRAADAQDRVLLAESARALNQVARLLSGQDADADVDRVWQARLASAKKLRELAGQPADVVRKADQAFHAQAIGIAASAAVGAASVASRRASPADVAVQHQRWVSEQPDGRAEAQAPNYGLRARASRVIATDASLRSVWFRNSARGAVAIAAAVAVAKLTDVQHAFWVVLGTLSVLRSSAGATGATAARALAGTIAGFVVGAALLIGIGTDPIALWIAFPLAVMIAAYTPGTAPFVAGQAAFTVTVVVLFNLLVPAGWKVGLLRVEDVAIGCAVSLVVGILFWPRGSSAVVGDNLAEAYRCGAKYLNEAANWALGEPGQRPERAMAAFAAGNRLDDAVRGYLTEQGSKRIAKSDLWTLVMAATRLRLAARSLASLPGQAQPHAEQTPLDRELQRQAAGLASFYELVAAEVARPGRHRREPVPVQLPASEPRSAGLAAAAQLTSYRPDALWVGHHLSHLAAHAAAVTGPAERLASIRRRPWWR